MKSAAGRPIVFGNWKMHGLRADAGTITSALAKAAPLAAGRLGVFPPFTVLREVVQALDGTGIVVGGQDCHHAAKGAFTGSISAPMLADAGATAVLLGHSERRHGLGETDQDVNAKAVAALDAGLATIVICIGETEAQFVADETLDVLDRQLASSIPADMPAERLVIAYEPVWAIGTGRTPSEDDIARVHAHVRSRLTGQLAGGADVPIQYGGSVKGANADKLLAVPGVDGALVGGACLDPAEFLKIFIAGGGRTAPGSVVA